MLEALKVMSHLQPKERFATQSTGGIYIQKPSTYCLGLSRYWNGESRDTNIQFLDQVLDKAFQLVDAALREKESFGKVAGKPSREHTLSKLKNSQLLGKLKREIEAAQKGVVTLGETYSTDMKTKSKIQLLVEKTTNRLEQMVLSVDYLSKNE